MAELAVATTLGLIQIITPLLSKMSLLRDMKEDITSMQSWLSCFKAFLADQYRGHGEASDSHSREDLIIKARNLAYDIEDVLDLYLLHSPPYTFHHHQISRTIHAYCHTAYHGLPLHEVSDRIALIRTIITDIRRQYPVLSAGSSSSSTSTSTSYNDDRVIPLLTDDELVGYEKQRVGLMDRLVDNREKRLVTVAIDGPPGSGKTSLVKNIYGKPFVRSQFDCCGWVSLSHRPVNSIFNELLQELSDPRREHCFHAEDHGQSSHAGNKLQEFLTGKKYLVVLDDISDNQNWSNLKNAFPNSNRGSRIVVTTRYSNLASTHDPVYSLNGLKSPEAWRLFCSRAFTNCSGECPLDLKGIATEIVARCEGLPLAINAVAGALVQKKENLDEWEKFHTNFGSEIRNSSQLSPINHALLRSYMDLPTSLKLCFLYMGIFPEDHSVKRRRLIRLWVAEGFAVATENRTPEEVAEEHLLELIHRNLIHVSSWDFDGRPTNCRVLNLVLKFIIQKSKEENFASIFAKENTAQNESLKIRRLSVHNHWKHFPGNVDFESVRSLFLLRLQEISSSDLRRNLQKLKLLKVLDVEGGHRTLTLFPNEIIQFLLMRYLSFRDTKISSIPSSIKRLSYLETLDLKQTLVTELPPEISYLHNLRHLFAYNSNVTHYVAFDSVKGVKLHKGINKLTNLQKLTLVKIGPNVKILRELKALTRLRKLGVTELKSEHGSTLCAAVEEMKSLKTLDISSASEQDYIELEEMRDPPKTLERLYLKGRLRISPTWISSLHYLMRIHLKWSKLSNTHLVTLKRLRNLTELEMVDCFTGQELVFEASGFKKLKTLVIEDLSNAKMIKIENGAMPEVQKMSLRKCPSVTMLFGVECLNKLEELTLYDMAKVFVDGISIRGDDRHTVQNIPLIHSFTLTIQGWSLQNLSHIQHSLL